MSVKEAIGLITRDTAPLEQEELPLKDCPGRVLFRDITAPISQPPFPRSPLDGYALRAADSKGASRDTPVRLRVAAKYYAGERAAKPLLPGEAARVMTGSMLPQYADCVIRQEDTDEGEETVAIYRSHRKYENYVFTGEDFQEGMILLPAETRLDAAALCVAASAGYARLPVYCRPRIGILSVGDELVEPGRPLPEGKIYNSSLTYLQSRAAELGAVCTGCSVVGDDVQSIASAITNMSENSDLVATTGGVSVGQKDLVPAALEVMGADIIFRGVRMKPGMPTTFARFGHTGILALSGNPFAAVAAFELLTREFLFKLGKNGKTRTVRRTAVLRTSFPKSSLIGRYVRGVYSEGHVMLPEGHSGGQMRSMLGCNCLMEIAPGKGPLYAGEEVEVFLL